MMSRVKLYPMAAAAFLMAFTLSCEEPTGPDLEPPTSDELLGIDIDIGIGGDDDGDDGTTDDPATASPLPCPTTDTFTATKTIGLWGGTVSAGGSSITLPFGAVLSPTTITLTVPPSEYMEVDIRANGRDHHTFVLPVTIEIGYQRCTDPAFDEGPLVAWYWDSLLDILLEPFPSVDDKTARTVTFESGHLSVFVIAN